MSVVRYTLTATSSMANASTSQLAHVCPLGPADGFHLLNFSATTVDEEHTIEFTIQSTLPCKDALDLCYYLFISKVARLQLYHNIGHIQKIYPQAVMVRHPFLSRGLWFGPDVQPDWEFCNTLNRVISSLPPRERRSTHA